MAGKIRRRIEAAGSSVIHEHDLRFLRPTTHDLLQKILPHELRAGNVDGFELFAGADVEQAGVVFLNRLGGFGGSDEDLGVLLVRFEDAGDDLGGIEVFIAGANAFEGLLGLETTTRAASNVVVAEQRALGPGAECQQFAHRRLRSDVHAWEVSSFEGTGEGFLQLEFSRPLRFHAAMKLISWNVNGIRSILGKGLMDYLEKEKPDILCLQEIKARAEQVPQCFDGYEVYWNSAVKPGYSGTAILTRKKPLAVTNGIGRPEHDQEGRVINADFGDFFLVNVYTPNSQRELTRLDYRTREWTPAFLDHLLSLQKTKPVIFCGDMNVAHKEIDLARPRENTRNAGFTLEEREAFDRTLSGGFLDTFRQFDPSGGKYTWWSYQNGARQRNIGWRIDYFCASEGLKKNLQGAFIQPEIPGSDHCPIGLVLDA